MNRRGFLRTVGSAGALSLTGCDYALREGLFNACHAALPPRLAAHPLVVATWTGIDATQVLDMHCHLFGNGDSGQGAWVDPSISWVTAPAQLVQRLFYLNAGCVHDHPGRVDASVVDRLRNLVEAMPRGVKLMLLAFDWARDAGGAPMRERSTFHVPDAYAAAVAKAHPQAFEWAASIHPYDPAAADRLDWAVAGGARAVKWLPAAQNIDPDAARCDAFYRRLAKLRIPLIVHAGDERAVRGHDESLGNPLRLRRALDQGVRVVVAHCASLGLARDLDRGTSGPMVAAFSLFGRLMDEPAYVDRLLGDLSAVTLSNRSGDVVATLLARTDWHARLVNGSDYPLPGVLPLVALDRFVARGMLAAASVSVLREIRDHNAILFDFVLKRALHVRGQETARFPAGVFETRRHFLG